MNKNAFSILFPFIISACAHPSEKYYDAGREAFNSGDYKKAIQQFEICKKKDPMSISFYNLAVAYEKAGDKIMAVKNFKVYLNMDPETFNKETVERRIAKLLRK